MKPKGLLAALVVAVLAAVSAFAQMDGNHMGDYMGSGMNHMNWGRGYGMDGAGKMPARLMKRTISHGYMDTLYPMNTPEDAVTAVLHFIDSCKSNLMISELWEYETVYMAELSDTSGAKAFDMMADKFTGAVIPMMGFPMMMNASYGKRLYRMPRFSKRLKVKPEQAVTYAQHFVNENGLGYMLGLPEIYPGYYKFHTTYPGGGYGMDIMVNGYNGRIWMHSLHGSPIGNPLP